MTLQFAEGLWHLNEWRSVAQSAGFALDYSKVVTPVVDNTTGFTV
jgi:hypothetical protein